MVLVLLEGTGNGRCAAQGWEWLGRTQEMRLAGGRTGQCYGREQTLSLGSVSSQLVLFMRMLFAVGCQADGNLYYRLSSWAVGVKTKLSLYSSTLMRSASPSCFGTGGVCFMFALDLVTVARKKPTQNRKPGPVVSTGLVNSFHPHLPFLAYSCP